MGLAPKDLVVAVASPGRNHSVMRHTNPRHTATEKRHQAVRTARLPKCQWPAKLGTGANSIRFADNRSWRHSLPSPMGPQAFCIPSYKLGRIKRKERVMRAAADSSLLAEMTRAVVETVNPEQVLVFGSHARGDATAESDVDLLVVESQPFGLGRSRRQELQRIRRALSRFPVPKEVLVYSRAEVERWKDSLNHIIRKAYSEGKVLYGHE